MDVLVKGKDGKLVRQDVAEADIASHFLGGRVLFHSPTQTVPVALKDGRVGTVPASEAEEVFKNGGRVVTQEEYHKAAAESRSGGVVGAAEATAAGLGRGLGVGLTDPALVGAGKYIGGKDYADKVRQKLAELKEVHPYLSFGSEMVGAVAPALAGDEASLGDVPNAAKALGEAGEAKNAIEAAKALDGPAAQATVAANKVLEHPNLPAGTIVPAMDESIAGANPALRAQNAELPPGPAQAEARMPGQGPAPANDNAFGRPANDNGEPPFSGGVANDNGLGQTPANDNAYPRGPANDNGQGMPQLGKGAIPEGGETTAHETIAELQKKLSDAVRNGATDDEMEAIRARFRAARASRPAAGVGGTPVGGTRKSIGELQKELADAFKRGAPEDEMEAIRARFREARTGRSAGPGPGRGTIPEGGEWTEPANPTAPQLDANGQPLPPRLPIADSLPPELKQLPAPPAGAEVPRVAADQFGIAPHADLETAGEHIASRLNEVADKSGGAFGQVLRNTPAGFVSRAGRVAEDMANGAVGELFGDEFERSAAGRIIAGAIRAGASGAIEGGLFAVGNEISEDTLGDIDLNAEKLMAAFGHGALLGSAFGFGGGAAVKSSAELARPILKMLAPSLTDMSETMAFRAYGSGGGRSPVAKEVIKKWGKDGINELGRTAFKYGTLDGAPVIDDIFQRTKDSRLGVGKRLEDLRGGADAAAARSQLPHERDLMNAIKSDVRTGDLRQYGEMHRTIVGLTEEEEKELNGLPRLIEKKKAALEELSRDKGLFGLKDPQGYKLRLKEANMDIVGSLRRQRELNRLWSSSELGKLGDVVHGLAGKDGRITFTELASWRAHVDKMITNWSRAPGDPYGSMKALLYKSARDATESTLIESMGNVLGKEKIPEYMMLKGDYHKLWYLEKKATASLAAKYNNQQTTLTSKILGASLFAHGNPVLAIASMGLHKAFRDRGIAASANIMNKMAQLAFIQKAVSAVDAAEDKAVAGVLGRAAGKDVAAAQRVRGRLRVRSFTTKEATTHEEHREQGGDIIGRVSGMANLPKLEDEHVSEALGGAATYAPKHVGSLAAAANMATQYLVSKLPQGHDSMSEIASGPNRISDLEIHDFQQHVEGSTDAIKVLHNIQRGTATPTHIEAFKKTHPLTYNELRNKIATGISQLPPAKREAMPMRTQMEMAALFDMPVTWAQTPAGMKLLQANDVQIAQSDGRPATSQTAGRMAPSKMNKHLGMSMETDIEKLDSHEIGEH